MIVTWLAVLESPRDEPKGEKKKRLRAPAFGEEMEMG